MPICTCVCVRVHVLHTHHQMWVHNFLLSEHDGVDDDDHDDDG